MMWARPKRPAETQPAQSKLHEWGAWLQRNNDKPVKRTVYHAMSGSSYTTEEDTPRVQTRICQRCLFEQTVYVGVASEADDGRCAGRPVGER